MSLLDRSKMVIIRYASISYSIYCSRPSETTEPSASAGRMPAHWATAPLTPPSYFPTDNDNSLSSPNDGRENGPHETPEPESQSWGRCSHGGMPRAFWPDICCYKRGIYV